MTSLASVVLGMDARMFTHGGWGISTYANALASAQAALSDRHCLITDRSCAPHTESSLSPQKIWRDIKARFKLSLTLQQNASGLRADDIYRFGRAHFRHHGVLLNLKPPYEGGIVHWTHPLPLYIEGWINVYTIHDVIPLTHPDLTPMDSVRHKQLLHAIIETADHIVTISEHARGAILRNTTCRPYQITDCSIAVSPPNPNRHELLGQFSRGGYYIYMGSGEPRKNLQRLVEAYNASKSTRPLLLVGDHAATALEGENVICIPRQPPGTLAALVSNARALLFPSLVEGFGLPIVEAMSLGTAVLTSNEGAPKEVAGGAALLVDPFDSQSISQGLSLIDADDDLVARLEHAGKARAAFFSPEGFAHRLERLYSELHDRL